MTLKTMTEAASAAERFLRSIYNAIDESKGPDGEPWRSVLRSAARRASMDLTRALAEMRKP